MSAEDNERRTAWPSRVGTQAGEFAGLTALVTGGASGIGLATAQLLTSRGARVAVLDRDKADEKHGLISVVADVTDDDAVRRAVGEAVAALGDQLDILVNNAGIGAAGTVEDNPDDEWHRVLDINVVGMARVSRAALAHLRRAVTDRGQAAIVNTCSVAAVAGLPQRALYSASKGAVLRADPGHGRRPRARGHPGQRGDPGHGRHPVGRPAARPPPPTPRPSAPPCAPASPWAGWSPRPRWPHAIAYLASPLSSATTGTARGRRGHDRPAPPPAVRYLNLAEVLPLHWSSGSDSPGNCSSESKCTRLAQAWPAGRGPGSGPSLPRRRPVAGRPDRWSRGREPARGLGHLNAGVGVAVGRLTPLVFHTESLLVVRPARFGCGR